LLLSAGAALSRTTRALQQSIDVFRPSGAQQQTRRPPLLQSVGIISRVSQSLWIPAM